MKTRNAKEPAESNRRNFPSTNASDSNAFDRKKLPDPLVYYAQLLGLTLKERAGNWRTTRCEFHGGSDSMRVNVETGAFKCMADCGAQGGDVIAYQMLRDECDFVTAAKALGCWAADDVHSLPANTTKPRPAPRRAAQRQARPVAGFRPWMRALWQSCRPVSGTAADYLRARRCVIPPAAGDLRWSPALPHRPSGTTGPALVALITHARTRAPLGLHRTWIKGDGTKPATPSKMMAGSPLAGGVIRLWPDEDVTYGLGIAEGIETALSLAHAFRPVWAAMDAGHIKDFPPLAGIESLTIAADRDENGTGQRAAAACRDAWLAAGALEVFITNQQQNDLNDVVMEVSA